MKRSGLASVLIILALAACGGQPSMNRLSGEKSPYLLQHAGNPVHWYPWGEEAFARARREDKPVFLSIGYSTCHWCHVMERESFEDPDVARLMNQTFVSIKVDREERPDIDGLYMIVAQMMTGAGGWPLTIVMTPDKEPFFAATYIPRAGRGGRAGMLDLIPRIGAVWADRREEIERSAGQVIEALEQIGSVDGTEELGTAHLEAATRALEGAYDERWGGFGTRPKFPTPHNLTFLLRGRRRTGDERSLQMAAHTLRKMRQGGIYDQVGFGFHRYATDREWFLPHFEKMLYDQAQLVDAYLDAYLITGEELFAETVHQVLAYILRDLTGPEGGFYSAEDADSEGEEGRFYLWTADELRRVLGADSAALMELTGARADGNVIDEATGTRRPVNHLSRGAGVSAEGHGLSDADLAARWERGRLRLLETRSERVRPLLDDKILTDWNGLAIAAMARAGRVLDEPLYISAAEKAAGFVLERLRRADGRLLHRYRDGHAGIEAHLEDYAFLVSGLVELYQATGDVLRLEQAVPLADRMIEDFWDEERGGLFQGSDVGERLLVRLRESTDGALPSGNSVAMMELLRLARLTGRTDLEERALEIGRTFSGAVEQFPQAHTRLLAAVDFLVGPAYEVVVAGRREDPETQAMLRMLSRLYLPNTVVSLKEPETGDRLAALAPYTRDLVMLDGRVTVYVCRSFACDLPTSDPEEVRARLTR